MKKNKSREALLSYFRKEKKLLVLTAVTGLIYNIGMTAGPWFEGQLAQYLYDILKGSRKAADIVMLSIAYVIVIAIVQRARALKRLYVRKFANNVSRSMKESIFHHLVHESTREAKQEDAGAVMTKAVSDAEDCAEGMRKFTTEIYDTGVVMIAYLIMLLAYDWRLTLIVILFPPAAYFASNAVKKKVSSSTSESKKAMSYLNTMSVDAAQNALTYRIYGEESSRSAVYEEALSQYERKNVRSGVWQNSPQPLYLVISMIGVIPILYFGGKNVVGTGWRVWTIASFSAYLSCFTKLATKSSHAAKLFNAIQKAEVSWQRIEKYLVEDDKEEEAKTASPGELKMENVSFRYEEDGFFLANLNLTAEPGEIIGITGKVASGKSTFGKLFLKEEPYEGMISFGGKDIQETNGSIFAYAGHDKELFTGTVEENITFGNTDQERLKKVMQEACLAPEVDPSSMAGMEGGELSGGQQARIALARALYSHAPVVILDDPFASVDAETEKKIFHALREEEKDRIILLISHRLAMFPEMDQVVFLEQGTMQAGKHQELMQNDSYASLLKLQQGGRQNA